MSEGIKGNIVLYQSADGISKIDVRLEDENVWLTQAQLVDLYQSSKSNISEHIKHIFEEGELNENAVVRKFRTTASDGKNYNVTFYNLDIIIALGHKVKPERAGQFRTWAAAVLEKSSSTLILANKHVNDKIFIIRGVAVMLDKHLAEFYKTETRTLKQAVRRNIERFPSDFMFELNSDDINIMVSQSVIPNSNYFGGAKPFVFTEQGVSMLSAVIRTPVAIDVSLKIIRAFVEVKNLVLNSSQTHIRLSNLEQKQLQTDNKINQIFEAIDSKELSPKQGVFFDGQIFDAYVLVADIIRSANKQIILIDNYVDDTVLALFSKKKQNVACAIYTKKISKLLRQDANKFNQQYGKLTLNIFNRSHDRFLIIDDKQVYHIGASLKDLGKKWFAFTLMDKNSLLILDYLK